MTDAQREDLAAATDEDLLAMILGHKRLPYNRFQHREMLIDELLRRQRVEFEAVLSAKDNLIRGLCDRVEAQSQLLAKRAEASK